MMLADIVVDQLVFVLGAPDDVLDPELPTTERAPVRQVAEGRLAEGQHPAEIEGALRELVLLLDEIEAA